MALQDHSHAYKQDGGGAARPAQAGKLGQERVIGINGEQEHGVAMLTTVFGNVMRDAAARGGACSFRHSYY